MALPGRCLTGRERDVVRALADTTAAPQPPLPPVDATDAVDSLDAWLARAPALNRVAMRTGLRLLGRLPGFLGGDRARRTRLLRRVERTPLEPLVRALVGMLVVSYYGDDGVMRVIGYDPDANLARARALG